MKNKIRLMVSIRPGEAGADGAHRETLEMSEITAIVAMAKERREKTESKGAERSLVGEIA